MKIEEGKFYRTRSGQRVGPARRKSRDEGDGPFSIGEWNYTESGLVGQISDGTHLDDIVEEWSSGPVRTVSRKEIVPGVYGRLKVFQPAKGSGLIQVSFSNQHFQPVNGEALNSAELREAAAILIDIADALEQVQ